jgi:hypothetical protein
MLGMTPITATRRLLLVSDHRAQSAAPAAPGVRRYRLARMHGERRQPAALPVRKSA